MRAIRPAVFLVLLAAVSCVPTGGGTREAAQQVATGDLEGARSSLEQRRNQRPRDVDARISIWR